VLTVIFAARAISQTALQTGEFSFNGKPVSEFHCFMNGGKEHPAVIVLHAFGPRNSGKEPFEKLCVELAKRGYYAEFIEYYGQAPAPQIAEVRENFPMWLAEIRAGLDAMQQNPHVDRKRIGAIGFSLGAMLALSTSATDRESLAAVVEYYGSLPSELQQMASNLAPTLILHGDADSVVPVARAYELDKLLTDAKRPHEMHIYPGAPHGFNAVKDDENAANSKDAWQRTIQFLDRYLKPTP
jgi:carboxymethylenebutenolidase